MHGTYTHGESRMGAVCMAHTHMVSLDCFALCVQQITHLPESTVSVGVRQFES